MMKLSIIIVNFNTYKLTLDCIQSVFKNAPEFPFEVIVVDNASSDGSVINLEKVKKITLIKNNKNVGFAKANNQAMKIAKGEYFFLLNSDTKIENDVFTPIVGFAESHDDAGVVAPRLLNPDKSVQPSIFRFPTISRAISQYWLGRAGILDKYSIKNGEYVEVEWVVGAAFLITPKAKKKTGVLDDKYFMYFEDLDYCKRVREAGLKVYYLPQITLIHIHGASGNKGVNTLLQDSSKIYFGTVQYYLYTFILWSGQKIQKLVS